MRQQKKRKRKTAIFLCIAGMLAGLLLLMLPFALDRYNALRNEQAISSMTSVYDRYEDNAEELDRQLEEAHRYNEWLAGGEKAGNLAPYEEQLSFDGGGVMGYLTIPAIDLKMLIYHGTEEETLAVGAGHLEGTSLPVGGASTHSVITAHSGMRSMRAFDDLRKLKEGDLFAAGIYGRTYVYEVESIETVLPYETDSLKIAEGEDRMTLVTCTPYGINDHRLLVHGIRTDRALTSDTAEPGQGDETELTETHPFTLDLRTAPLLLAGLLLAAGVVILLIRFRKKRKEPEK